jgi:NAD+ synthase
LESANGSLNKNIFAPPVNSDLVKVLVNFVKQETERIGFKKCVIGLSGGIDSAVAAYITQKAVGSKNLLALLLPYKESSKDSIKDALTVANKLKIKTKLIDVSPAVDTLIDGNIEKVRKGNIIARMRMICLYDYSYKIKALVIGTGNKTEILLGYTTLYGDSACAINPVGDLYKTQIWQLAELLKIPKNIIRKKPSADLWMGQTDEGELGFTYKEVDRLLYLLIDCRYSDAELIEAGFKPAMINRVKNIIMKNQFKRLPPIIAKVSNRTVNVDFRYNRDWGS